MVDALMPDGYSIRIAPEKGNKILEYGQKYQIKQITAHYNRLARRDHLRELARKGGIKSAEVRRREGERRQRRKAKARHAASIRWKRRNYLGITGTKRYSNP